MKILKPKYWKEYNLLDFGNGVKVEKFYDKILIRPETEAKNQLEKSLSFWNAKSVYKNDWSSKITDWIINYKSEEIDIKAKVFLSNSKHVGIFPEQAVNWEFIAKNISKKDNFLNLFGYTGIASLVAAKECKQVTHIDSSPSIIKRAKQNAEINQINNIRFINDDALLFCKKELKRGNKYKGIILDPPVFGFGTKGKSWKLTKNIEELLKTIKLLCEKDAFIILNTYSPQFKQNDALKLLHQIFGRKAKIDFGKLALNSVNNKELLLNDFFVIKII